jgi:cell division protein FtsB
VPKTERPFGGKDGQTGHIPVDVVARSRFMLIGAVIVSGVILVAWFPGRSLIHQRSTLAGATAQLSQLHQQDAALTQEEKKLSDSSEIARIAREQYQLVSPGQQAFEVLPPSGSAASGTPYAGDPGSKAPVAPSAASELPPGGLAATTVPTRTSTVHARPSAEGALQRMLNTLEFWR